MPLQRHLKSSSWAREHPQQIQQHALRLARGPPDQLRPTSLCCLTYRLASHKTRHSHHSMWVWRGGRPTTRGGDCSPIGPHHDNTTTREGLVEWENGNLNPPLWNPNPTWAHAQHTGLCANPVLHATWAPPRWLATCKGRVRHNRRPSPNTISHVIYFPTFTHDLYQRFWLTLWEVYIT